MAELVLNEVAENRQNLMVTRSRLGVVASHQRTRQHDSGHGGARAEVLVGIEECIVVGFGHPEQALEDVDVFHNGQDSLLNASLEGERIPSGACEILRPVSAIRGHGELDMRGSDAIGRQAQ